MIFYNDKNMLFRFDDWVTEQMKTRQNVRNILKHLNKRGTPPPKVWWVPPTGVRSVLRLALRYLILVLKANKTQKGEKRTLNLKFYNCVMLFAYSKTFGYSYRILIGSF